jgi:hypothetical protein
MGYFQHHDDRRRIPRGNGVRNRHTVPQAGIARKLIALQVTQRSIVEAPRPAHEDLVVAVLWVFPKVHRQHSAEVGRVKGQLRFVLG